MKTSAFPGAFTRVAGPARIVEDACRVILEHAEDPSDLSRATVVLPDAHAAAGFARALRTAAAGAALLLPRLTTLRHWAAEMVLERPVASGIAREAAIYHALAERGWFDRADLWGVAAELAALFDELTRWHVGMPASLADFERRLLAAYESRGSSHFAFEARLVHELWRLLGTLELDAEAAYAIRLGRLAATVEGRIYTLALRDSTPAENQFFARCAERVPVLHFAEELDQGAEPLERMLAQVFPQVPAAALQQRARALRASMADSPLEGRLRVFGAADGEQQALAVDAAVRAWLRAGRSAIAVVALDRAVARRARALLERADVLVRDEAGWPLSTTSAATAIARLLEIAGNDCYHRDLLDLLKSPFAFPDWPPAQRRDTVARLERLLRKANVRAGLARYQRLAERAADAALGRMLLKLQFAIRRLGTGRRKPLAGWLVALRAALRELGVEQGLESDAAGSQLLELVEQLTQEIGASALPVAFGEFRRWLGRRLETASFRDTEIESPVVFTSLEATRLRRFDALVLVGADADHLPGVDAGGMLLNERVRRELKLPTLESRRRQTTLTLAGLLCRSGETLITWQRLRASEPNLVSPLVELLLAFQAQGWGGSLADAALPMLIASSRPQLASRAPLPQPAASPAPRLGDFAPPASISASGYNVLMACPYRFFVRYVLGLRESDEVQDELDKADYGTRVHDLLARFHAAHPSLGEMSQEAAEEALRAISAEVFREDIAEDYAARAWLARWQAVIPRYVEWQREREAKGWRFHAAEVERSVTLTTPAGRSFTLKGRIDRVDAHVEGAVAVVDYKTQTRSILKAALQTLGEDVQLAVYALLWNDPVTAAFYLSADGTEVHEVAIEGDVGELAAAVRNRLAAALDRMADGAPLPAYAVESACRFCEAGGLCRRKHWA